MTGDQFTSTSIALLRSSIGWQTRIAERLGIAARTVRRWLADGEVPDWVALRLTELTGLTDQAPWPRDEWVTGDTLTPTGGRREYLVHLQPPRFVARIVAIHASGRPERSELPADVLSGTVYSIDLHTVLCEIEWIDQPSAGEIVGLMEAAADHIDENSL